MTTDYTGSWPAKIKSWDLVEVEKLGQLKLVIWFDVHGSGWTKAIKWEGFFLKKDGTHNKKTYSTLKSCGFNSNDISNLVSDERALDTTKVIDVTVISEDYNGETYYKVDWVGQGETEGAVKEVSKLKGFNINKLNAALKTTTKATPKVKNYGPTTTNTEEIDEFMNS
jgi:hypothetical protein